MQAQRIVHTAIGSRISFIRGWPVWAKVALVAGVQFACLVSIGLALWGLPLLAVEVLTTVSSIQVKVIGQPGQALKLWRAKSAGEMSVLSAASNNLSYMCWVGLAVRTHNVVVLITQGGGVIGSAAILTLVLWFVFRQPMTEFGHTMGTPCKVCMEVIAPTSAATGWPQPCFGCSGSFHAVRTQTTYPKDPTDRSLADQIWTRCDTCNRTVSFEIGPLSDPSFWKDFLFFLKDDVTGSSYVRVTLQQYVAAERRIFAKRHPMIPGPQVFRVGLPSQYSFTGHDGDPCGQIETASGKSLSQFLAEQRGQRLRQAQAALNGS